VGFNLLVGGGLSIEHGINKTYARTASELAIRRWRHTLAVAEALSPPSATGVTVPTVKRTNIRWSVGVETFKAEVGAAAGIKFEPIRPQHRRRSHWLGEGIDNKWHLTLFIENGRFSIIGASAENGPLEIAKIHKGELYYGKPELIIAACADSSEGEIEKSRGSRGLMMP
jgi:sulfite reductase (NADPH) hemoprotein beta-component